MLNIIKSIYSSVKSRVKHDITLSEPFTCNFGVRQGECLSTFLFAMYVNDLEAELAVNGISGINMGMINLYILLYADDIIIIIILFFIFYTDKTKIMVFRKGGRLPNNLNFNYKNVSIEMVNNFLLFRCSIHIGRVKFWDTENFIRTSA